MNDTTQPQPPVAARQPHTITMHGHSRVDEYYWLREKEDPAVIAYLQAENAYTEALTAHSAALRETLYKEMVGRIKETDDSVPVREGEFYYYTRTEEGKQYAIYCRKHRSLDAPEQVLLDLNAIAAEGGHSYLVLGIEEVSPDHRLLAYGLDTTGAETYTIRFKDLETGALLPDTIENAAGAAVWADNQTLFYTTEEESTKRSHMLHRHALGTPQADDVLVYHEPDALYSVYPYVTKDKQYLFVYAYGIETRELRFIPTSDPTAEFQIVEPRTPGLRYAIDHRDGLFYIVTNADGALNNKLMTTSVATPGRAHWQTLIDHRVDVKIEDIELFADWLVRYERSNGLLGIQITRFADGETHSIAFPESVYTLDEGDNPEFDSGLLRFNYTSLVTPGSVYDYDMAARTLDLKKQQPVLGGYNAADYTTERIYTTADDGKRVAISLVYRKDAWDGSTPAPLHLYGYGSYGYTIDPRFSSNRVSLLDRGLIFAIAHIRGEQIFGREWYEDGKFLNKKNTFSDFVACARHLIAQGYTAPDRLTIEGRSAGGLLIGAVLNLAPQLFRAAIAGVPFVDVVTTMLDESLPLTVGEFDEWGNPKDERYYHYMLSYSPYDNLTARAYPAILVTAGLNDPRVQYWEPAKWVARLRTLKQDQNVLLLKMHMGAGHFASSGRYDYLKDIAFDYAFLLDQLGITA